MSGGSLYGDWEETPNGMCTPEAYIHPLCACAATPLGCAFVPQPITRCHLAASLRLLMLITTVSVRGIATFLHISYYSAEVSRTEHKASVCTAVGSKLVNILLILVRIVTFACIPCSVTIQR